MGEKSDGCPIFDQRLGSYRHRECCYLCSAVAASNDDENDNPVDPLLYTNWGRGAEYRKKLLAPDSAAMAMSWLQWRNRKGIKTSIDHKLESLNSQNMVSSCNRGFFMFPKKIHTIGDPRTLLCLKHQTCLP